MLAYTIHTERIGPMNDPTITDFFTTLADAKQRVDRRRAEIENLRAEIENLRAQLSIAHKNIVTTIDEIETNRIMTHEERSWVKRLEQTANDLDPYQGEHDDE